MIYTGRALVGDGGVVYRDNPVTALALDPGGRYLYAATLGKIHVIDLDPNSPDYLKIISNDPTRTIDVSIPAANGGTPYGHVTDIALNANGKRLYVTVPVSEMYGPNGWVWQAGNDEDQVIVRSEEHTSELQSLMRISYAVFCWKKKKTTIQRTNN